MYGREYLECDRPKAIFDSSIQEMIAEANDSIEKFKSDPNNSHNIGSLKANVWFVADTIKDLRLRIRLLGMIPNFAKILEEREKAGRPSIFSEIYGEDRMTTSETNNAELHTEETKQYIATLEKMRSEMLKLLNSGLDEAA